MAQRGYRRVAQEAESTEAEEGKKKQAERIDRITAKIHAGLWVVFSIVILFYTNLLNVAFSDERVNRYSLNAAIVCFVANMGIVLYLTLYLPLVLKVTAPWEIYCPHLIPISTVLGLLVVFLFVVAFYPIYGMLTPLIMGILLMVHTLNTRSHTNTPSSDYNTRSQTNSYTLSY